MSLPCGGDRLAVQTLVDLAVELETVGWDGVFLEDYLVHYRGDDPATYDPWLVLAAVAGAPARSRSAPVSPGCSPATRSSSLARRSPCATCPADVWCSGWGWVTPATAVRASTRCGTRSALVVSRWTSG